MRPIIFLTQAGHSTISCDDHLAIAPLRQRGIEVTQMPWQQAPGALGNAELVIIRSTYDYIHQPTVFFQTLAQLEQQTPLANPASVVKWNMEKTYLLQMAAAGLAVIPTLRGQAWDLEVVNGWFAAFATSKVIVKPTIGASSDGIFVLEEGLTAHAMSERFACLGQRPFLIQPFVKNVVREGELSLFFFNKTYSHGVLKQACAGEFRVQQEFGGSSLMINPPEKAISLAQAALDFVSEPLLYARVDMVRLDDGFALMELELIEPQLFLENDPQAPERFADAILESLVKGTFAKRA